MTAEVAIANQGAVALAADLETVGGPIDVAVISKGDGFVWVKRKHYFPADLNNHFFRNYFRGIDDEK